MRWGRSQNEPKSSLFCGKADMTHMTADRQLHAELICLEGAVLGAMGCRVGGLA